jgi:hypothetical protein
LFGQSPAEVVNHFAWTRSIPSRTAKLGIPEVFAALYLSLLAGSADEDTHTEGDFRNRFTGLVKHVKVGRLAFSDLRHLWKHVAAWSEERARSQGDCRILLLPDPGYEKLIGYSKRLAFPSYQDGLKLQVLLQARGLGSGSAFREVALAVALQLGSFSAAFQEEFALFRSLVAKSAFEDAYNSPFWGAIQAITWEDDRVVSLQVGKFCLGADASDPDSPEFYLLTDEAGRASLQRAAVCRSLPVQAGYRYAAELPGGAPWTPARLLALVAAEPRLARARLWKHLAAGCAALFPDRHGTFSQDGDYCDGSRACLLVEGKLGQALLAGARHLGMKPSEARAGGIFDGWTVLLFESISSGAMSRLADSLPPAARQVLPGGWRPSRISCTGGAWFGQSLLANPASSPLFSFPGADSGTYALVDAEGVSASGSLDPAATGFVVPPAALSAPGSANVLLISLSQQEQVLGQIRIPLAKEVPLGPPAPLSIPGVWVADGPAGSLSGLGAEQSAQEVTAGPGRLPPLHPWLEQKRIPAQPIATAAGLDGLAEPAGWLCEALSLRLQRRQTLSYPDLYSHLLPACAAADVRYWLARRLLFCAGWIVQLQKRTSHYPVLAAAHRTIALHSTVDGVHVARIAGMFPASERAQLLAALASGEHASRIAPKGGMPGIGAIELRLSGGHRIAGIAAQFGLEVLGREAATPPVFLPPQLLKPDQGAPDAIRAVRDAEVWDAAYRKWMPLAAPERLRGHGCIARTAGQQRRTHWISAPGGWLKTSSEAWAFILALGAQGKPLGYTDAAGNGWLDAQLDRLPLPLVQWWMHWGGGCIAAAQDGGIILASRGAPGEWHGLRSWFPDHAGAPQPHNRFDTALQRRGLALSLRKGLRPADY